MYRAQQTKIWTRKRNKSVKVHPMTSFPLPWKGRLQLLSTCKVIVMPIQSYKKNRQLKVISSFYNEWPYFFHFVTFPLSINGAKIHQFHCILLLFNWKVASFTIINPLESKVTWKQLSSGSTGLECPSNTIFLCFLLYIFWLLAYSPDLILVSCLTNKIHFIVINQKNRIRNKGQKMFASHLFWQKLQLLWALNNSPNIVWRKLIKYRLNYAWTEIRRQGGSHQPIFLRI